MATTVTNPVATVTLTGTAEQIVLPSKYSWVWVRNDTDTAVYISQTEDVGEGVSGSVAIPAGGAARLALTGDSFYAIGTGAVQIVAANYTDCPFKTAPAASGGGSESGGGSCSFDGKLVQWGTASVQPYGARITFPRAYKALPTVFVSSKKNISSSCGAWVNETTNVDIYVRHWGASSSGAVSAEWGDVSWLAIGEPVE